MSSGGPSSQLDHMVERSIRYEHLETFARYWRLYQRTAVITEVEGFFLRIEDRSPAGGYCNVAIIGNGLLVDVEGDDVDRSGTLTAHSLDAFNEVFIHIGPLRGLPSSQGARLVVVAELKGQEDAGTHWVAKTFAEEDMLLEFAAVLIGSISRREDR